MRKHTDSEMEGPLLILRQKCACSPAKPGSPWDSPTNVNQQPMIRWWKRKCSTGSNSVIFCLSCFGGLWWIGSFHSCPFFLKPKLRAFTRFAVDLDWPLSGQPSSVRQPWTPWAEHEDEFFFVRVARVRYKSNCWLKHREPWIVSLGHSFFKNNPPKGIHNIFLDTGYPKNQQKSGASPKTPGVCWHKNPIANRHQGIRAPPPRPNAWRRRSGWSLR